MCRAASGNWQLTGMRPRPRRTPAARGRRLARAARAISIHAVAATRVSEPSRGIRPAANPLTPSGPRQAAHLRRPHQAASRGAHSGRDINCAAQCSAEIRHVYLDPWMDEYTYLAVHWQQPQPITSVAGSPGLPAGEGRCTTPVFHSMNSVSRHQLTKTTAYGLG